MPPEREERLPICEPEPQRNDERPTPQVPLPMPDKRQRNQWDLEIQKRQDEKKPLIQ